MIRVLSNSKVAVGKVVGDQTMVEAALDLVAAVPKLPGGVEVVPVKRSAAQAPPKLNSTAGDQPDKPRRDAQIGTYVRNGMG
jgi:hypothetical protein